MAEITSFTAERILAIENSEIVSGGIDEAGSMTLRKRNDEIIEIGSLSYPPGAVIMFAGSLIPTGWMLCNGSAISRTAFANLFAVLGTEYGSGDGSSTFNIPNFSLRFPMGDPNALGASGGSSSHSHTVSQHAHTIADHVHTVSQHTHTVNAHTHTISDHTHTINGHTHSVNDHAHEIAGGSQAAIAHINVGVGFINADQAGNQPTYSNTRRATGISSETDGSSQDIGARVTGRTATGGNNTNSGGNNTNSAGNDTNSGGNNTNLGGNNTNSAGNDTDLAGGNTDSSSGLPPYLGINFIIKT